MITPAKELAFLIDNVLEEGFSRKHDREKLAVQCGELLSKISNFLEASTSNGKPYLFFQNDLGRVSRTILQVAIGYDAEESDVNHAVFALNALDAVMEKDTFEPFQAEPEDVRTITSELKSLLSDANDLSSELRLYCFNVIAMVEHELQRFEVSNQFDTQEAVERLTAAINVLLAQGNKSRVDTLQRIWQKLMGFANFSNTSLSAINGGVKLAELTGGQG